MININTVIYVWWCFEAINKHWMNMNHVIVNSISMSNQLNNNDLLESKRREIKSKSVKEIKKWWQKINSSLSYFISLPSLLYVNTNATQ